VQQTFPCLCVTTQKAHTSHSHVLIIQRSWDLHSELGSTRHLSSMMAACDLEEFEHRLPLGPSKTLDCCLRPDCVTISLFVHTPTSLPCHNQFASSHSAMGIAAPSLQLPFCVDVSSCQIQLMAGCACGPSWMQRQGQAGWAAHSLLAPFQT
jgi:hypothetical protein